MHSGKFALLSILASVAVGSAPDHLGFDPSQVRPRYVKIVDPEGRPMADVMVRYELVDPSVFDLLNATPSSAGGSTSGGVDQIEILLRRQEAERERDRWSRRLGPRQVRTDEGGVARIDYAVDSWTFELTVEPTSSDRFGLKRRIRGDRLSKDQGQPLRVQAVPSTTVSGRVTVDGLPVSGAVMELQPLPDNASNIICLPSDDMGMFHSPPIPPWRIGADGFVAFMQNREVVRPINHNYYPKDLEDGLLSIECYLVREVIVKYLVPAQLRRMVENDDEQLWAGLRMGPGTAFPGWLVEDDGEGELIIGYWVPAGHSYSPRMEIGYRHGYLVKAESIDVPALEIPQRVLDENGGAVPADDAGWHPAPLEYEVQLMLEPRP